MSSELVRNSARLALRTWSAMPEGSEMVKVSRFICKTKYYKLIHASIANTQLKTLIFAVFFAVEPIAHIEVPEAKPKPDLPTARKLLEEERHKFRSSLSAEMVAEWTRHQQRVGVVLSGG